MPTPRGPGPGTRSRLAAAAMAAPALPRWALWSALQLFCLALLSLGGWAPRLTLASPWSAENGDYNLNQKVGETDARQYAASWPGHTYFPSPTNWRMPFYTLLLDRFANGNPENDGIAGTPYETDVYEVNFRHGGDVAGLLSRLDYVAATGAKGVYIAGTPFENFPWDQHGYSPLDLTLLDRHLGSLEEWRALMTAIHARGMYVMMDMTVSTLSDLLAAEPYGNLSTPLNLKGYNLKWKSDLPSRRYADFEMVNTATQCPWPTFYTEEGFEKHLDGMGTCYEDDFDHYGDMEAWGAHEPYERILGKFGGVQDRLRDWNLSTNDKMIRLSCLVIEALDVDAFRVDKATQITTFGLGRWADGVRQCAKAVGKTNFFLPGEITAAVDLGAIYLGRGRMPDQRPDSVEAAALLTAADTAHFQRAQGESILDSAAFHYSVYRGFQRFLGLDGVFMAGHDLSVNPLTAWGEMQISDELTNAYTGRRDVRHMYGGCNQDTFRWPAVVDGIARMRMALLITSWVLPGIPLYWYGDEQDFKVLDSRGENYQYGRQPMTSSLAWQMHGCYTGNASRMYYDMPFESTRTACSDPKVSYDHFDPTQPSFMLTQLISHGHANLPVLRDAEGMRVLWNATRMEQYPGSNGTPTEKGVWGARRYALNTTDVHATAVGGAEAFYVLHNENTTVHYAADCMGPGAMVAPFPAGTTLVDLLPPYNRYTLQAGRDPGTGQATGCLADVALEPYQLRVLVTAETAAAAAPPPMLAAISPAHDERFERPAAEAALTVPLVLTFTQPMACDAVTAALRIRGTTGADGGQSSARIVGGSCTAVRPGEAGAPPRTLYVPEAQFQWRGTVGGLVDGIYEVQLDSSATSAAGVALAAPLRTLFRVGLADNPMVFPQTANFTTAMLAWVDPLAPSESALWLRHAAPGADMYRASVDFGMTWTPWRAYNTTTRLEHAEITGSPYLRSPVPGQEATVTVEYWSQLTQSTAHRVWAGLDLANQPVPFARFRRFPQLLVKGPMNAYGNDKGVPYTMKYVGDGEWAVSIVWRFPTHFQLDVWGDYVISYGDVDGDGIIDRLPPTAQDENLLVLPRPAKGYLGWKLILNDRDHRWRLEPAGRWWMGIVLFVLLLLVPIATALLSVHVFKRIFYPVIFNASGRDIEETMMDGTVTKLGKAVIDRVTWRPMTSKTNDMSLLTSSGASLETSLNLSMGTTVNEAQLGLASTSSSSALLASARPTPPGSATEDARLAHSGLGQGPMVALSRTARHQPDLTSERAMDIVAQETPVASILIATLEYDIPDWQVKVRIGGLGAIASLMAKHMTSRRVVWVVPKIGGIVYPSTPDTAMAPIMVTILGRTYPVQVCFHQYRNVKYILLDAGIFRARSKEEPYTARMDDLESAVFYSTWNQCIAAVIDREGIDLYHVNDFHGSLAPLYLLPRVIPIAFSLHNAEFQGLWPLRTSSERHQVCSAFNIPETVCTKYVQYGNTFNLLHAGVSYLRIHQSGHGAAGVSDRYGVRSHMRYPSLWGLQKMGGINNPNPADVGDEALLNNEAVMVPDEDPVVRAELKRQAQHWAGLCEDPKADLIIFVGRWSKQKGVDLIADLCPEWLELYPKLQLIAVGPVIDLYGRMAAMKLDVLAQKYPDRIYSKPEFTVLPKCVFESAEFVLIPSRDEPFGLVAVEFGRYGALGIGSFTGGLGTMPGWWFPIESAAVGHLHAQFRDAMRRALASTPAMRAEMRNKARRQRFPVTEWLVKLDEMYAQCMKAHRKGLRKKGLDLAADAADAVPAPPRRLNALPAVTRSGRPARIRRQWSGALLNMFYQGDMPSDAELTDGERSAWTSDDEGSLSSASLHRPDSSASIELGMQHAMLAALSGDRAADGSVANPDPAAGDLSRPEADAHSGARPYHPWRLRSTEQRLSYLVPAADAGPGGSASTAESSLGGRAAPHFTLSSDDDESADETAGSAAATAGGLHARRCAVGLPPAPAHVAHATMGGRRALPVVPPIATGAAEASERPWASAASTRDRMPSWGGGHSDYSDVEVDGENDGQPSSADGPRATGDMTIVNGLAVSRSDPFLQSALKMQLPENLNLAAIKKYKDYGGGPGTTFFDDEDGKYVTRAFAVSVEHVDSRNSTKALCIENLLMKGEKGFFDSLWRRRLRPASLLETTSTTGEGGAEDEGNEIALPPIAPRGPGLACTYAWLQSYAVRYAILVGQRRIGDWPVYAVFMAIGQLLAASAFQLVLLAGGPNTTDADFYLSGMFFILGTMVWWSAYRYLPAVRVVSIPFLFYALALLLVGIPSSSGWLRRVAMFSYSFASASGSLFFSLNFGEEAGVTTTTWVYRAAWIDGTRTLWISALWYWGSAFAPGSDAFTNQKPPIAVSVVGILLCVVTLSIFAILHFGLPVYYRQMPGSVPALVRQLLNRRLVIWFVLTESVRSYFLSGPYGRTWSYLWEANLHKAGIAAFVVVFFVGVWGALFWALGRASRRHTWLLPVFAIGLIAPGWAQIWWATSGIGHSVAWAGAADPGFGLVVFCWLAVLAACQNVGVGMILLQTLTRIHTSAVLMLTQFVGAAAVMLAHGTAPDVIGPGPVFGNPAVVQPGERPALQQPWFWIVLVLQIASSFGYLFHLRREQLSR